MLSVFANIRINHPERLEHLKDSFFSFSYVSDNWVVNVRGALRLEAIAFLKEQLGEKMVLFELLDDDRGWMSNALEMMRAVKYDYVLLWNEDHINLCTPEETHALLSEAIEQRVDYLHYGHYEHWRRKFNKLLGTSLIERATTLDVATVTKENVTHFFPERKRECIVSSPAFFQKTFLTQQLEREGRKWPLAWSNILRRLIGYASHVFSNINQRQAFDDINRTLFHFKLPRFPKQTPFELEITQDQQYILPVRVASPHKEFFACIDDDVQKDGTMNGYQLIKRGQYPIRNRVQMVGDVPADMCLYITQVLTQGEIYRDRYYVDTHRTAEPLRAVLRSTGVVKIRVGEEELQVSPPQLVQFYPNLPHVITALTETKIEVFYSASVDAPVVHPMTCEYIFSNL